MVLGTTILFSCENMEVFYPHDSDSIDHLIEYRTDDPGCAICPTTIPATCCCFVEGNEPGVTIDLYICGILNGPDSCWMDTESLDPCYNVNNLGINTGLDYLERQYFCMQPGRTFSLHNANGSGDGRIRVGCSGNNMPAGSIGVNLDYLSGGFTRYFRLSGCTVQPPCSY